MVSNSALEYLENPTHTCKTYRSRNSLLVTIHQYHYDWWFRLVSPSERDSKQPQLSFTSFPCLSTWNRTMLVLARHWEPHTHVGYHQARDITSLYHNHEVRLHFFESYRWLLLLLKVLVWMQPPRTRKIGLSDLHVKTIIQVTKRNDQSSGHESNTDR